MAEAAPLADASKAEEVDESGIAEETLSKGLACILNQFAEVTGYVQYG